jgi:carboxymethylenebutenolidase
LSIDAYDGRVDLTRYATDGMAKRAAVLILHGARGVEIKPRAYERYATAIAAAGMDAYLVRYMTAGDRQALGQAREDREAYETQRFDALADRVSSIATAIMARADSTGRIGLLGFSLGGYIAAETGARDEHIAALAVIYGGMPEAMASKAKRMPPLLEIHGDADRNVPLEKGEALVRLAKAVGAPAEQVTYPGRGHGFDFSDTDPMTSDAVGRVVRFFQAHLIAA